MERAYCTADTPKFRRALGPRLEKCCRFALALDEVWCPDCKRCSDFKGEVMHSCIALGRNMVS